MGHRSDAAASPVVIRPTLTFHVFTALLAVVVALSLWLAVNDPGLTRWLFGCASLLGTVVVANRVRARVVVDADRVYVGHELGARGFDRKDIERVSCERDGLGWSGKVGLRDGRSYRMPTLAAFQRDEAAVAVEELREALSLSAVKPEGA